VALLRDRQGLRDRQTHSRRSIFASRKTQPDEESSDCSGAAEGAGGLGQSPAGPIGPPSQQVSMIMPQALQTSLARISNVSP
jgi:hypothetical protein